MEVSFGKALGNATRILAGGLQKGRFRRFWARMDVFLNEELLHPEPLLPAASIRNLFPESQTKLKLTGVPGGDGNVSELELVILALAAREMNGKDIFEIGTFNGRTTVNLAANAPESEVFTLDLPAEDLGNTKHSVEEIEEKYIKKNQSGQWFMETEEAERIVQLWGDSAQFDFSPYANRCGLIFVDGSHAYEYVLKDAVTALELARDDRAMIFFHDYASPYWDGVTSALNKLYHEDPRFSSLRQLEGTTLGMLDLRNR